MNVKTAEQYLARYIRRGEARQPKTHRDDRLQGMRNRCWPQDDRLQGMRNRCWPQDDHAFRSKPNHAARAAALPMKPLGPPRRPVQKSHPKTAPLTGEARCGNYYRQTGRAFLTARQRRRWHQKRRVAS